MLQYLWAELDELDDPVPMGVEPSGSRRRAPGARPIPDTEVPVFALLRAQFGLPSGFSARWPAPGRHVAVVPVGVPSPTDVSDPTIDLLERTLAALRAW